MGYFVLASIIRQWTSFIVNPMADKSSFLARDGVKFRKITINRVDLLELTTVQSWLFWSLPALLVLTKWNLHFSSSKIQYKSFIESTNKRSISSYWQLLFFHKRRKKFLPKQQISLTLFIIEPWHLQYALLYNADLHLCKFHYKSYAFNRDNGKVQRDL